MIETETALLSSDNFFFLTVYNTVTGPFFSSGVFQIRHQRHVQATFRGGGYRNYWNKVDHCTTQVAAQKQVACSTKTQVMYHTYQWYGVGIILCLKQVGTNPCYHELYTYLLLNYTRCGNGPTNPPGPPSSATHTALSVLSIELIALQGRCRLKPKTIILRRLKQKVIILRRP